MCRASGECENGGVCGVVQNEVVCECGAEYSGARCQIGNGESRSGTGGLGTGAAVGIGVGCAVAVGVAVVAIVYGVHRYKTGQYTKRVNEGLKENHMANLRNNY